MSGVWIGMVVVLLVAGAAYLYYRTHGARQVPEQLRRGRPLPEFAALDEAGNPLHTRDLRGAPVVIVAHDPQENLSPSAVLVRPAKVSDT